MRDARTDVEGALVPDSVVDGFTAGALVHVIDEVTTSIEAEAARLSRAPRQLATTLRAVLVPTDRLVRTRVAFSVGDGATLRLHDSAWSSLQQQADDDSGMHDTATAVLPVHPEELRLDLWSAAESETVVICTDGISGPLRDPAFAELPCTRRLWRSPGFCVASRKLGPESSLPSLRER